MIEISPIKYEHDRFSILDQTRLPGEEVWLEIHTKEDLWDAIHELKVRGAPAIGCAAALGMAVLARDIQEADADNFAEEYRRISDYIATSRPTAVNLFWALNRMQSHLATLVNDQTASETSKDGVGEDWAEQQKRICDGLLTEALTIRDEDEAACRAMGEYGLSLLEPGMGILTHCNAGALATSRYGTCLAPIHLGQEKGYDFHVYAEETRPLLQGARLTAWELSRAGVDVTLICDNMAATVMKQGKIDAVVVGCDRMAANGDGANKIGTSGVAILAKEYEIPFYMFVPTSTIDLNTKTGADIEIEERDGEEIYRMWYERPMAPEEIRTFNPAFDVTDHNYITAVVTERGIVSPPFDENLQALLQETEK